MNQWTNTPVIEPEAGMEVNMGVEEDFNGVLKAWLELVNIAEEFQRKKSKRGLLREIGDKVVQEYDIDYRSMSEWRDKYETAIELAGLIAKEKSTPWPNASNFIMPLVSQACIQFAARAYPNIVKDTNVVMGKVIGHRTEEKLSRAQRVGDHMSYQLLEEMEGWEEDTDKLLTVLSLVGTIHRKTYYNPGTGTNVSEYINPKDVVVNYYAPKKPSRITHIYQLYPNEIEERIRGGIFTEFKYGTPQIDENNKRAEPNDEDSPHIFLEQHRWLDLDEDGYKEPYIVTVHKDTREVVRITARYDEEGIVEDEKGRIVKITPVEYFTKYIFLPAFDDSYFGVGFGTLLGSHNVGINGAINRLMDAGWLQNAGGGFLSSKISGLKAKIGGILKFKPGEWKIVSPTGDDLQRNIVPLPTKEPSRVLFELMVYLIDAGKELTSSSDLLAGKQPNANQPATTTMAMIDQGLKVFTAIYKRIHRSLHDEFRKLRRLNRLYLDNDVYFNVNDNEQYIAREDYDDSDCDVIPVSNPEDIADPKRLMAAEALINFKDDPDFNSYNVKRRYMQAIGITEIDEVMKKPEEQGEDPMLAMEKAKIDIDMQKLELEARKLALEEQKTPDEIRKLRCECIKLLADAESKEAGIQLDEYKADADRIKLEIDAENAAEERKMQQEQLQAQQKAQQQAPKQQKKPAESGGVSAK